MRAIRWLVTCFCYACLSACSTQPISPSPQHLLRTPETTSRDAAHIPPLVTRSLPLPPPRPGQKPETYSVVVTDVPAQEVLFALARDAKINLDIHSGIQGNITLNALDQTLPQLLRRISRQVDMRYELDGASLIVMPDTPFLRHYKIDYVNMTRDAESAIANATQVSSGTQPMANTPAALSGNNSSISIRNTARNRFWETLIQNIKDILHETDKILPEGSSETIVEQQNSATTTGTGAQQPFASKKAIKASGIENSPAPASMQEGATTVTRRSTFREAASVIANPETGLVTVRATGKQHEKVQEFVDRVMVSARRQVLIEATVVEVRLSDQYKQGINWSLLQRGGTGFQLRQAGTPALPTVNANNLFILDYLNPTSRLGNLSAQVSLLESFGTVKVLSSPKLSVLNNQTAMLRVVDNLVYFTVKADTTSNQTTSVTTYTTTPNTVPIGFTMSVTPQIDDSETVLLNLKPSISRVIGFVNDPNPDLAKVGVTSRIPQTQTREMESVLKISSRQIAVMGGLMQDQINNLTDAVPGLSRLPLAGNFFAHKNDLTEKTELVIFLRPQVLRAASLNSDLLAQGARQPDGNFFQDKEGR